MRLVGSMGYRESRRRSRDTYPVSYITKYTKITWMGVISPTMLVNPMISEKNIVTCFCV